MAEPTASRRLNPPSAGLAPERQAEVAAKVIAQVGQAVGVRAAVEGLRMVLRPDEDVICAATGFLQGRTVLVLYTTERILVMRGGTTLVDLNHASISRFRARSGVTTHELQIENRQGNILSIKQIHPRGQLEALSRALAGSK